MKKQKDAKKLIEVVALFGVLGMVGGEVWNRWFPTNKNLWTSSFVLFSGGFALLFVSLLYWMIEVKGRRGKWTMPILVFGLNAIAGFVADSLIYGPGHGWKPQDLALRMHHLFTR